MVASVSSLLAWRRSFTPSFSPLSEVNGASAPTSNANNSSGEETEHGTPPKTFIQPFDIKPRARPAHRPFKQPVLKKLVPDQSTLPTLLRSPFFPQGQRKPRPVVDLLFDEDEDEDEDDDKYVDAKQNFVTQVVDDTSQKPAHHLDEAETSRPEEDAAVALELEKLRMHDKAIFPGSITKCEKIGSGGFKDVYSGMYCKIQVAVCDIRGHMSDNEIKELKLLSDLSHDNIVKFVGVVVYDNPCDIPCSLVTELCAQGDLFDFVRRDDPVPPFGFVLQIFLDISKGLDYLHSRSPKIIHRDMKSSNVLITERGTAKITDFGLAKIKNSTRSMVKSLVGTVNWQAPEQWVPKPQYDEKIDCFAAGLIFWECLQWHQPIKRYPFEGMNEHAIYKEVGQKQVRPSTAGMGRRWGPEILDLIARLWDHSPAHRPSMRSVIRELSIMRATWQSIRA